MEGKTEHKNEFVDLRILSLSFSWQKYLSHKNDRVQKHEKIKFLFFSKITLFLAVFVCMRESRKLSAFYGLCSYVCVRVSTLPVSHFLRWLRMNETKIQISWGECSNFSVFESSWIVGSSGTCVKIDFTRLLKKVLFLFTKIKKSKKKGKAALCVCVAW
jgi:hypothetical protein